MPNNLIPIPLEDDPCDVLQKAMRGTATSTEEIASASRLSHQQVIRLLQGEINSTALKKAGNALNLDGNALSQLVQYKPNTVPIPRIHTITSPYGHAGVNAYMIEHGKTASVIDTGTNSAAILKIAQQRNLHITRLLITHEHPDHTAGVATFRKMDIPIIYPSELDHNTLINIEIGTIRILDVAGHAQPAKAYYYDLLDKPICIVGDSIFAGSIGGTPNPTLYQQALKTARQHVMTLPPETILCPGHGPLTTVLQESTHNPFLIK